MMKEERRKQLLDLRDEGLTYEEIGEKVGISRQRVYQLIGGEKPLFRAVNEDYCVYPNIRRYMNENRISVTQLTRLAYGDVHTSNIQRMHRLLEGSKMASKTTIDRVLWATGLPYEVAFAREEEGYDRTR